MRGPPPPLQPRIAQGLLQTLETSSSHCWSELDRKDLGAEQTELSQKNSNTRVKVNDPDPTQPPAVASVQSPTCPQDCSAGLQNQTCSAADGVRITTPGWPRRSLEPVGPAEHSPGSGHHRSRSGAACSRTAAGRWTPATPRRSAPASANLTREESADA